MLKKGFSLTAARKTPIICGLLLSSSIVVANYTQSVTLVILVMSIAFFAKGVGNLGWCIVGDVSPRQAMGISGAMFNFCGNIASIVTPIAIGVLVAKGSFDLALVYVAAMGLLGAFAYLFIVGPLKRMELGDLSPAPEADTPSAEPDTLKR